MQHFGTNSYCSPHQNVEDVISGSPPRQTHNALKEIVVVSYPERLAWRYLYRRCPPRSEDNILAGIHMLPSLGGYLPGRPPGQRRMRNFSDSRVPKHGFIREVTPVYRSRGYIIVGSKFGGARTCCNTELKQIAPYL